MKSRNDSKHEIRFTSAARKARALRKLGVSAEQLASAPEITPFLMDSRGSSKPILQAMRFSESSVVQRFLATHDSLGAWARENTCWEAIAISAGVEPEHFLGAALLSLQAYTMTKGKLVAMSRFPEVLEKRIEYAKRQGGWRDRDALDKLLGFLPTNHPSGFKKSASRNA